MKPFTESTGTLIGGTEIAMHENMQFSRLCAAKVSSLRSTERTQRRHSFNEKR